MSRLFTLPNIWSGGEIELAIEIGPRSNIHLVNIGISIWGHPKIEGFFLDNKREPTEQQKIQPSTDLFNSGDRLIYGVATLSSEIRLPFKMCIVRFDDGQDWISLGIPIAALSTKYPVGAFPFKDDKPLDWRREVFEWMRVIGGDIYQMIQFQLGLIGFDILGDITAAELSRDGVPSERWFGYLIPRGNKLDWYPPNQGAPFRFNTR